MKTLAVCSLLLLAATGCSTKVEVQSNGCYHGEIGSRFVDACGNRTFTLKGDPKCATLTLKDEGAYLRARIKGKAWSDSVTSQFDSVTVCD